MVGRRRMRRRRRRRRRRRVALVGGLIAVGSKKMTAAQAKAIEEHTGLPPEDLEDGDLEEALKELGIPDQEVGPDDSEA